MEQSNEPKNRRKLGSHYEEEAARFLKSRGLYFVAKNFRSRTGEIDLIFRDGKTIVFVEVKYRKDEKKGDPLEAVDLSKQARIRETARYYLYRFRYAEDTPCRFDVVGILGGEIHWVKNAF